MIPHLDHWKKPGYSLDQELADEIRYKLDCARPSTPFPGKTFLIFILLGIAALFCGIHFGLILALALFVLFVLGIQHNQKEGDALQIDCPRCSTTMTKEWQANVEFFSCSKCHIYAIGRDES